MQTVVRVHSPRPKFMYKDIEKRRAYDRKYYESYSQEKKKRKRKLAKKRRDEIQAIVNEYKAIHPCECGEKDIVCLDFHHNNKNKEISISNAVRMGWSLSRIMKEIKKCKIVCANCHRKMRGRLIG